MKNKLKILIVEDSEIIREKLQNIFSTITDVEIAGFSNNSKDGIDKFFEIKPDILILDLMLKSGTGFELLENIRHRSRKNIVVVFTNYSYPFIKTSCMDTGADYFLDKSNDFEILIGICEDIRNKRYHKAFSSEHNVIKYLQRKLNVIANYR